MKKEYDFSNAKKIRMLTSMCGNSIDIFGSRVYSCHIIWYFDEIFLPLTIV